MLIIHFNIRLEKISNTLLSRRCWNSQSLSQKVYYIICSKKDGCYCNCCQCLHFWLSNFYTWYSDSCLILFLRFSKMLTLLHVWTFWVHRRKGIKQFLVVFRWVDRPIIARITKHFFKLLVILSFHSSFFSNINIKLTAITAIIFMAAALMR